MNKTVFKSLVFVSFFIGFSAHAGVVIKSTGSEKMVLTQIDKKTFKKASSEVNGTNQVTLSFGNISQSQTEAIKNIKSTEKDLSLTVLDGSSVRVVDLASKIDEVTKAEVSRNLLMKVKSIKIHRDDYLRLYSEVTKQAFRKQLTIGGIDITRYLKKADLVIDVSDLDCQRTSETELTCNQTFSLTATLE